MNQALGGFVLFSETATAASATVELRSGSVAGASGGRAQFQFGSSAGSATFSVLGSGVDNVRGPEGGHVQFLGNATAADASFVVGGNQFAGGGTGRVAFSGASTAGRASIVLAPGLDHGGELSFEGSSASFIASAGEARIMNGSSSTAVAHYSFGGQITFLGFSTAGGAFIDNGAGTAFGITHFFLGSDAGDATIANRGGAPGLSGGLTQFNNSASAARAIISNESGAMSAGGFDAAGTTSFRNQASAGQARITAQGATSAGAVGGLISFQENGDPAQSTLIAEGGTGAGTGGRIRLADSTNSSWARVVLQAGDGPAAGGNLDISALAPAVAGVAMGSLEGGGMVALGGKKLIVGFNGASTTFSGHLGDGGINGGQGGSLGVVGTGALTLTGANTYTGATHIGDGINAGSGKLTVANSTGSATGSGPVFVERGGTLGGSGFIAGPVTLRAGGTIAPGDPVTLTLRDSLTWDGGGVIRLVLGANSADSDHLDLGALIRGANGEFRFDFVDAGIVVGESYELLHFDSLVGFEAGDFSFSGSAGTFSLENGGLAFTAAAVPEQGTAWLLLAGLVVVVTWQRRRAG